MLISEFIDELEHIKSECGDIIVHTSQSYGRGLHEGPRIAYTKILKGREFTPKFYDSYDPKDRIGDLVCRV